MNLGATNGFQYPRCPSTNKYQFKKKREALDYRRYVRKNIGVKVKPYVCPDCHYWHLGHYRATWKLRERVRKAKARNEEKIEMRAKVDAL